MRVVIFHLGATNPDFAGGRFWPLLQYLSGQAEHVIVVTPSRMAERVRRAYPGFSVIAVPQPVRRHTKIGVVINYGFACLWAVLLKTQSIDIAIALTGFVCDAVSAETLARRSGAASVAYVDNLTVRNRPERTWWAALDRIVGSITERLLQRFDVIFAGSNAVARDLRALGVSDESIHVTGYGIGGEVLDKVRGEKIARTPGRAVFVARISAAKGVFDLLRAWENVVATVPYATLHIMGAGEDSIVAALKGSIARSPVRESIRFLGHVDDKTKFRELLGAQTMVFPTYSEQYSQSVAEALACGLHVITYDIEGFRENFPGLLDVGPVGDIDSLSQRLISAIVHPQAPEVNIESSYKPYFDKEQVVIDAILRKHLRRRSRNEGFT